MKQTKITFSEDCLKGIDEAFLRAITNDQQHRLSIGASFAAEHGCTLTGRNSFDAGTFTLDKMLEAKEMLRGVEMIMPPPNPRPLCDPSDYIHFEVPLFRAGVPNLNGVIYGMPIIESEYVPRFKIIQHRFPKSKKKRIRRKWAKQHRNHKQVPVNTVYMVNNDTLVASIGTTNKIKHALSQQGVVKAEV
jgi:hypothetical protein